MDGHVVCANASSSLTFMPVRMLAPDALEEENRQAQVLDGVHQFGSHHVCSSGDGLRAASAGFGGELLVWVNEGGVWQAHKSWKGIVFSFFLLLSSVLSVGVVLQDGDDAW